MKLQAIILIIALSLGLEDHFPDATITELNSTVIMLAGGMTFNGNLLSDTDEVAGLTFQDTTAGSIVVQNPALTHVFPIYMDDAITPELDGYEYDEPIRMHLWKDNISQEYDETFINIVQDTTCLLCAKDLLFKPNLLYIFDQIDWSPPLSIKEGEPLPEDPYAFNVRSYPNPFRSMVSLVVNIPHHTYLTITTYNLLGQEVEKEAVPVERGRNTVQLTSLVNYPSGMYYFVVDYGQLRLTASALKIQ